MVSRTREIRTRPTAPCLRLRGVSRAGAWGSPGWCWLWTGACWGGHGQAITWTRCRTHSTEIATGSRYSAEKSNVRCRSVRKPRRASPAVPFADMPIVPTHGVALKRPPRTKTTRHSRSSAHARLVRVRAACEPPPVQTTSPSRPRSNQGKMRWSTNHWFNLSSLRSQSLSQPWPPLSAPPWASPRRHLYSPLPPRHPCLSSSYPSCPCLHPYPFLFPCLSLCLCDLAPSHRIRPRCRKQAKEIHLAHTSCRGSEKRRG
mmetsp:Transcript_52569/g.139549  ORF Transcript_52569/g.139549 Transcript_52569/m.139549 type:complete len:259 (-) Transcript_52569:648-1424(-)